MTNKTGSGDLSEIMRYKPLTSNMSDTVMKIQEGPVLNKAESRDYKNYINFLIDKNKVKRKPISGKN